MQFFSSYSRIVNDRRALHPMWRLTRYEFGQRLAVTVQLAFNVGVAWCVPESILSKMFATGGISSHAILISMSLVLFLLVVDMSINDLMPDRFVFHGIINKRLLLFSMVAACYVICALATLHFDWQGGGILVLGYLATAIVSAHYVVTLAVWGLNANK